MDVLSPRMHFFVIVWFNNFFVTLHRQNETQQYSVGAHQSWKFRLSTLFFAPQKSVFRFLRSHIGSSVLSSLSMHLVGGFWPVAVVLLFFFRRVWSWKDVFVWLIYTTVSNKARFDGDYDRKCFFRVYLSLLSFQRLEKLPCRK